MCWALRDCPGSCWQPWFSITEAGPGGHRGELGPYCTVVVIAATTARSPAFLGNWGDSCGHSQRCWSPAHVSCLPSLVGEAGGGGEHHLQACPLRLCLLGPPGGTRALPPAQSPAGRSGLPHITGISSELWALCAYEVRAQSDLPFFLGSSSDCHPADVTQAPCLPLAPGHSGAPSTAKAPAQSGAGWWAVGAETGKPEPWATRSRSLILESTCHWKLFPPARNQWPGSPVLTGAPGASP